MYNDHPRDPKFVAVVERWSLFRGSFTLWKLKLGPQNSGHCRQVVAIRRWLLTQVWLYFMIICRSSIQGLLMLSDVPNCFNDIITWLEDERRETVLLVAAESTYICGVMWRVERSFGRLSLPPVISVTSSSSWWSAKSWVNENNKKPNKGLVSSVKS